ncbi:acetylglutamate kinase [Thermobaculum terrenum ATCC BAA-798]|uniref:Putative [LysW]-aminoadipate kinase n=1 Tax=Thermobaculum terrenum (strain ATCC BAA-798 / CCMEE 7001 / YNP1) TaxID=525904 RepID=D1CE86_THET1|nr:[LysW]-aminoadipate kinase [Thermobaculum terrenum]ACZ41242.1 acetylglutamate kinase [Thermobaculum terrenum ATCC BAA-798]
MLVIKIGGSKGINVDKILEDVPNIQDKMVIVHGANYELNQVSEQLGHPPRIVTSSTGQVSRFTDRRTMEIFMMVYCGKVNKTIVEKLQRLGVNAVGLSALDGGIAKGRRKDQIRVIEDGKPKVLRGDYAGSIQQIDTRLINLLLDNGYLPVLTPPAISHEGEAINVDGDKLAMEIAAALHADKFLIFSDTPGLLRNLEDENSLITRVGPDEIEEAMQVAEGRAKKKVLAAGEALKRGIGQVIFADGRVDAPIQKALSGIGTVIG